MRSKQVRYWVNQPSMLQPNHYHHGKNVIAIPSPQDPSLARVYFTEGDWVGMDMNWTSLSPHWH